MEYQVTVNEKRVIQLTPSENGGFVSGPDTFQPDIRVTGPGEFSVILNNRSYVAEIISTDLTQKSFKVRVNGNEYVLKIADKYDKLLQELGMDASASRKAGDLKAPMPGLVVDVAIEEGMDVRKGDKLIVLEAMKMENILKAAADGRVKKINVIKGNTVEKNTVLVQFQ
ncbi:MAG TPA: biotin/lipoyl-containing protein [Bacteroidia bacterium]|nr:biotin/lipoyl-containing protein [Bacteroidia bacterium]